MCVFIQKRLCSVAELEISTSPPCDKEDGKNIALFRQYSWFESTKWPTSIVFTACIIFYHPWWLQLGLEHILFSAAFDCGFRSSNVCTAPLWRHSAGLNGVGGGNNNVVVSERSLVEETSWWWWWWWWFVIVDRWWSLSWRVGRAGGPPFPPKYPPVGMINSYFTIRSNHHISH